jgi:hypothetical protein
MSEEKRKVVKVEEKKEEEKKEDIFENIPEFLKDKFAEYMLLDKKDLAMKLAQLDFVLEHADSETRYWLENLFKPFRGIKRNYEAIMGILTGVKFSIEEFTVFVEETIRRYDQETDLWEKKYVKVPKGSLIFAEVIEEQKEVPRKKSPYEYYPTQ